MNWKDLMKMWMNLKWVERYKQDLTRLNDFCEMRWSLEIWELWVHEFEMNNFLPKREYELTYELMCRPVKVMCRHILKRLIKNGKNNSTGRPIHGCVDTSWSIFDKYKNSNYASTYTTMSQCIMDKTWLKSHLWLMKWTLMTHNNLCMTNQ